MERTIDERHIDVPAAFGLEEDPPTPEPKTSNDTSVVTDDEVYKATGGDDPTALSRDDDIKVEPEHYADGTYWSDTAGMTETIQRAPADNFEGDPPDGASTKARTPDPTTEGEPKEPATTKKKS